MFAFQTCYFFMNSVWLLNNEFSRQENSDEKNATVTSPIITKQSVILDLTEGYKFRLCCCKLVLGWRNLFSYSSSKLSTFFSYCFLQYSVKKIFLRRKISSNDGMNLSDKRKIVITLYSFFFWLFNGWRSWIPNVDGVRYQFPFYGKL